ncbi:MAG: glycoside hydrolase family 97 C-terminal domain-containing protein, partial [Verrucomicrobiota bacterium]
HEWHTARHPWVPERILEPQHDVILPFTRFVVGHGDYTPTVFAVNDIHGNTFAHELAQPIVFTSPFLCFGGQPKTYLDSPAKDLIAALPATWDETLVLPGSEPGKLAAFARRKGDQWFVAVLNGTNATTLDISLNFLRRGNWQGTIFDDVSGKSNAWNSSEKNVNTKTSLSATLSAQGGYVAWIRK